MRIEETYNIHKKISCIFPYFKSKFLCKKKIHNYQLHSKTILLEPILVENGYNKILRVPRKYVIYWKCACCGREEKFL